jgi:hypothetical protein
MASIYVINAKGERELFSSQKVYKSARSVGASSELANKITSVIEKEIYPEIKTLEIFKNVKRLLNSESPKSAIRFNLKDAMRKLGPSGFSFEKFVGNIFQEIGYKVKLNQYISGFCLPSYEIDFLAEKDNLIYIGECKYRNLSGEKIHSNDILINHARFLDIIKGSYFKDEKYKNFKIKTILVTNEKFTTSSKKYSQCNGLDLLGWKYPQNQGLEKLIEDNDLYPITVLSSLTNRLKDVFASQKIMLVKDLLKIDHQKFIKKFDLLEKDINLVLREVKNLYQ